MSAVTFPPHHPHGAHFPGYPPRSKRRTISIQPQTKQLNSAFATATSMSAYVYLSTMSVALNLTYFHSFCATAAAAVVPVTRKMGQSCSIRPAASQPPFDP